MVSGPSLMDPKLHLVNIMTYTPSTFLHILVLRPETNSHIAYHNYKQPVAGERQLMHWSISEAAIFMLPKTGHSDHTRICKQSKQWTFDNIHTYAIDLAAHVERNLLPRS